MDSLTVSRFETDLPDMPTVQWFEETIGTEAVLELDDCGEGTGDPESASADQPLCVSIAGSLVDGRTVGVSIQVGNANQGLVAPPFVRMIWITDPRGPEFLSSLEELGARFAGRR